MIINFYFKRSDIDNLKKDGFENGEYDYGIWDNCCKDTVGLSHEGNLKYSVGDIVHLGNFDHSVSFRVLKASFFVDQVQCRDGFSECQHVYLVPSKTSEIWGLANFE